MDASSRNHSTASPQDFCEIDIRKKPINVNPDISGNEYCSNFLPIAMAPAISPYNHAHASAGKCSCLYAADQLFMISGILYTGRRTEKTTWITSSTKLSADLSQTPPTICDVTIPSHVLRLPPCGGRIKFAFLKIHCE